MAWMSLHSRSYLNNHYRASIMLLPLLFPVQLRYPTAPKSVYKSRQQCRVLSTLVFHLVEEFLVKSMHLAMALVAR